MGGFMRILQHPKLKMVNKLNLNSEPDLKKKESEMR